MYSLNMRLDFKAGLLGIYHLDKDTYIDDNISIQPIAIKGSDGLTRSFVVSPEISWSF